MSIVVASSPKPEISKELVYNFAVLKHLYGGYYTATKWVKNEGLFDPILKEVSRQAGTEIKCTPSEINPVHQDGPGSPITFVQRIERIFHINFSVRMEPHSILQCRVNLNVSSKEQHIKPEELDLVACSPVVNLDNQCFSALLHPFSGSYDESHLSYSNLQKIQRFLLDIGQRTAPDPKLLLALE